MTFFRIQAGNTEFTTFSLECRSAIVQKEHLKFSAFFSTVLSHHIFYAILEGFTDAAKFPPYQLVQMFVNLCITYMYIYFATTYTTNILQEMNSWITEYKRNH